MEDLRIKSALLAEYLSSRAEILLAYVFGSAARGGVHALSDVDVAVLVDEKELREAERGMPWGYQASLTGELTGILRRNDVDLVLLQRASPLLKYEIVRFGELLFCRGEGMRIDFEVRVRREYLDTEHLRGIQRSYLYEDIKAGRLGKAKVPV